MNKKVLFVVLTCIFVACGNKKIQHEENASNVVVVASDSIEDDIQYEDGYEAHKNLRIVMQSIIDGDPDKLATVTDFPILQTYPMQDISNADELKQFFDILFDDSIKQVLRKATIDNWDLMGWRGWTIYNGDYLWTTEEGLLRFVTYDSQARKDYEQRMKLAEQQDLNESTEWITHSCYLATDKSVFLRLEEWDGVERLHVFTHSDNQFERHLIFNGSMEYEGSCHNEVYWYACEDSVITILVTSPMCIDKQDLKVSADHVAIFPRHYSLPDILQGKTFHLENAYWREVKKWWE